MTNDQERTIDKVLKLLAKAESTTPEEAEALTAKATALMEKEMIDQAMLAAAQGKQTDEIITHTLPKFINSYAIPQQQLAFAVGEGFGFKLLQTNYSGTKIAKWVGWKSDIARAEVLFTSLLIQQSREAEAFIKPWRKEHADACKVDPAYRYRTERDFMVGFADGTRSRLMKARREAQTVAKAEQSDGGTGMELVLLDRKKQVDEWYDQQYGKLRAGRSSRVMGGHYDGYDSGHAAALRADHGTNRVGGARGELGR